MKEIIKKYQHSITVESITRLIFALLCAIFVSSAITQWTVQSMAPLPHWGEYVLYSILLLCMVFPSLYIFEVRPLGFLIGKLAQAERTALITSEYLSNLISSSSVILFSMRAVGNQLHPEWVSSDNLYRLLGYSEEEALQRDWWFRCLHAQDRDSVVAATAKLFRGEAVTCDYRFMHKNGSEVWIHDEQKLMDYDEDGKPTHVLCMWYDITRQKMVEQELNIASHMFDSHEGIIVTDANMVIQRVNPAFTQITGYSADDIVGKIPEELNSGRQDAMFYRAMWQTIQRDGYWQGEMWNKRKNGEIYPEWFTITAIKDGDGNTTHHVGTFYDITDRNGSEERIRILAFYDPLTKLPNRRLLQERIDQAIAASTHSRQHAALLFLDLDRFKILNDTYGHNMGDQLLLEVTRRLQFCVHEDDTIARLGGDEFVMILNSLDKYATKAAAQAKKLAEMIGEALAKPYHLLVPFSQSKATITYHSSASIGVVLFLGDEKSTEELMKYADLSMYEAKHAGRDTVCIFDPGMQTDIMARASLEADLHRGLQDKQFVLHYQPQVDTDGNITGSEALVRWIHPQRGMVSPIDFVPLAEESGLILPLGLWVLETACAQLAIWGARQETAHLTLAVNVSAHQFRQVDFVEQVLEVLERTGADPFRLKLELTESLLVSNVEDIIIKMTTLKEKGVSFSLDDFGTGYSSLSYLKRLPLDQLKIDQGFVRDVLIDLNDAAIAKMVIALAESMGLVVIAEGVESEEQRRFLARHGCHAYQGYLFSKPLSLEHFEAYIAGAAQKEELEFDNYSVSTVDSGRIPYQVSAII
ncbi:MAG: bifunctional diguanylate cyclase/phosphodiesterase [Methylobacter sp.]|nr:MAG: bifunctional diguanylate cyclase/phosphodiesterase [Methylobacter sp.]